MNPVSIESVADRLAIMETISRYGHALDFMDRDALADCFTEDAVNKGFTEEHHDYGPIKGRQNIVDGIMGRMDHQFEGTKDLALQPRHCITNFKFDELTDNSAQVTSMLVAPASENHSTRMYGAGWYLHKLEKSDGVWRISHLEWHLDLPVS
ncbi:nuclear transport factor 2 family protein [Sinisalibacter aestuarii]|uniref:SnoaL-like domain-containing protein n=1 Tax=Sinisalibacter aestuarii TaxID=2949426 RepID=A0ABQ5LT11_9RHOB|nr:nuclear transport factor 2 family protein [Sinisalibacter aestuarii]GKY87753.1 hypothetical protein STA1M1_16220 [Sinisalibacter aestuarii]